MTLVQAIAFAGAFLSSAQAQTPTPPAPNPTARSGGIQARVAPPARILDFTAQPTSVQPGQPVILNWATENPNGVTIEPGLGRVTPRGTRQVTPAATTTYTLTVRGPNNTSLTRDVTVTVAGTAPQPAVPAATRQELPRLSDGKPDFSGVHAFSLGRGGNAGTEMPLKPGAEKYKVIRGPKDAGLTADCMPLGVPGSFNVPYPFQIVQTPKLMVVFYEYPNTFRIIPTDGRPHPKDPDPTWMGDAVGHWEGDTLVVDTIGFNDKTEINGYKHTEAYHVVERFRRPEVGSLQYEVTVEDPNLFARPWTMPARTFPLRPELDKIDEFVCENNRDYTPLFK